MKMPKTSIKIILEESERIKNFVIESKSGGRPRYHGGQKGLSSLDTKSWKDVEKARNNLELVLRIVRW